MRYILAGRYKEFEQFRKKLPPDEKLTYIGSASDLLGVDVTDVECIGDWRKRPDRKLIGKVLEVNAKRMRDMGLVVKAVFDGK
jgi:hypothetical protein